MRRHIVVVCARNRTRVAALAAALLLVALFFLARPPPRALDAAAAAPAGPPAPAGGGVRGVPTGVGADLGRAADRDGPPSAQSRAPGGPTLTDDLLSRALVGLAAAAGASLLFLAGLFAARAALGEAAVVAGVVAAFEAGGHAPRARMAVRDGASAWDERFASADARARVPRPALLAELAELLRPASTYQYALVVGESGTGKSTAVRAAIRMLPAPKGVIYFSAPERVALFSDELAAAVGYFAPFNPLASFYSWWGGQAARSESANDPHPQWAALRAVLPLAADAFLVAHGRPAVLVIDAADYVAKKDPAFFGDLQDFAKVCADGGALRVVFVSSEGVALPLMRAASARSRMRVLEVPDIADADAVEYLVGRGVARADAAAAVRDVAGGRFALLAQAAAAAEAGRAAALREELSEETAATLAELKIAPAHALFAALLERGRVKRSVALQAAAAGELDALLARNILALHADGAYTVHARHIESWLRGQARVQQPPADRAAT
jgi:hypothetical protein